MNYDFRNFLFLTKRVAFLISNPSSCPSFPPSQRQALQPSVSIDAYILGTSEKETYTWFGLLCLVSLTYNFRGSHAVATSDRCSLFLLNHIGNNHPFTNEQLDSSHLRLTTNTLICLYKGFCVGHIASFFLDWNLWGQMATLL